LERLAAAGIGPFLVNTHYLADKVTAFVEESTFREKTQVTFEGNLLGTAGTLIKKFRFFSG
jgi:mannose-1-phosphate guanylyltransferase